MALYLVGDLQGCFDELESLLDTVAFDPAVDQLWLTGDLVARGPKSLECLRLVKSLGAAGRTVLGNHDLHLLSIDAGFAEPKPKEQLEPLLAAPDRGELLAWLRQQPLLLRDEARKLLVVHAGLPPGLPLDLMVRLAEETEQQLRGDGYRELLRQMYGSTPNYWQEHHHGYDRHRFVINALTRMRYCFADGSLDFACKSPPGQAPSNLHPWFELDGSGWAGYTLVFGHWAALMGQSTNRNAIALDTGCVWGNHMTLLRWDDRQLFHQPALRSSQAQRNGTSP